MRNMCQFSKTGGKHTVDTYLIFRVAFLAFALANSYQSKLVLTSRVESEVSCGLLDWVD